MQDLHALGNQSTAFRHLSVGDSHNVLHKVAQEGEGFLTDLVTEKLNLVTEWTKEIIMTVLTC